MSYDKLYSENRLSESKVLTNSFKKTSKRLEIKNVVVIGQTGSGKTRLLNCVSDQKFTISTKLMGSPTETATISSQQQLEDDSNDFILQFKIIDTIGYGDPDKSIEESYLDWVRAVRNENLLIHGFIICFKVEKNRIEANKGFKYIINKLNQFGISNGYFIPVMTYCDLFSPDKLIEYWKETEIYKELKIEEPVLGTIPHLDEVHPKFVELISDQIKITVSQVINRITKLPNKAINFNERSIIFQTFETAWYKIDRICKTNKRLMIMLVIILILLAAVSKLLNVAEVDEEVINHNLTIGDYIDEMIKYTLKIFGSNRTKIEI